MPERDTPDLIAPLVARFERRRPVRAGSLIITLYGDAIAPRGGSLWLGSLNKLVAPFGIEPGLVRTAMSRLVAEGWFDRNRVGKSSYYRLSPRGAKEFGLAAEQIYASRDPQWSGKLDLMVLVSPDAKSRQTTRDAFVGEGFGQLAPNIVIRPLPAGGVTARGGARGEAVRLEATTSSEPASVAALMRSCWDLDALASAYQTFVDDIGPIARRAAVLTRLDDAVAFETRLLLIHEWRRIVLRDPRLPRELLPRDWPGIAARDAVRDIYRAASPGCERWLDAQGINEKGPLPPAATVAHARFDST